VEESFLALGRGDRVKLFGIALLVGSAGYVVGVFVGIALVNAFSSPKPDKSMEAVMTGFFYVGPVLAVLSFVGTLLYQLVLRGAG
jgi:F0F1-type ATP synthase membrane subunit c/vacuolar-type H+-ATPase subunit K